jgi:cytochrome c oxidase assembly factor CtaG
MKVSRPWPGFVAVVLVIASLVPPAATYARQYVFAEALQFAVFAIATPALVVLAAPWRLLRVPGGHAAPSRGPHRETDSVRAGQRRPPFVRAAGFLALFAGVSIAWRLPGAVDALARHPGLTVLELASLTAAGVAFWLELAESPPFAPRLTHLQRAVFAALAMWITWILAYVLGFSHVAWFHAYTRAAGQGLSAVADQEIATGTLWAVAAVCFLPVIFVSAMAWLADKEDPDEELGRVVRGAKMTTVRGWSHPRR